MLFFSVFSLNAQINEKIYDNSIRLNYMSIDMPQNKYFDEPKMGLGGLHYQLPLNNFLYVTTGMYYALLGDQGGLFTLGAGLGFNTKIYKNLYFDGNIHLGGGGGYRVLVNSGAYINTNIGLEYKKKDYVLGIQYSYLDFLTGKIKDNAWSVYVQIPNKIHATSYKNANKKIAINELKAKFNRKSSKSAMLVRFNFFNPIGETKRDIGTPLKHKLYVLGFEYQKYIKENLFLYVHTDAIYKGLRAGFMDLFFGAGFHPIKTKFVDLNTKLGIGSAGGRIAREGGITFYPSIGLDFKIYKNLSLATNLGYIRALDGDFEAKTYGFALKYNVKSGALGVDNSHFYTQGFVVSLENQTYLNMPKTDDLEGKLTENLQLIGVNLNYDLNNYFSVFGEAGFAYKERAGGYAHGLIGLGLKTPRFINDKFYCYLKLASGVAGGGAIDTKEGLVFRPNLGISYDISNDFSVKTSYGRFITYDGKLNSTNFNFGVSYNIAFLNH